MGAKFSCIGRIRGFTLVELLIVLTVVGVLAAVARPLLMQSFRRSQEFVLRDGLQKIRGAIDAYKRAAEAGHIAIPPGGVGYPSSLNVLIDGVADARSPSGKRLQFLRRLPRDPFADPALPPALTWGLRASDSGPDDPRVGSDVYDVFSLSEGRALNGSRYRDW